MNKGACLRLLFCHRPVTGRLIWDVFAENLADQGLVVAQFWMLFNNPILD